MPEKKTEGRQRNTPIRMAEKWGSAVPKIAKRVAFALLIVVVLGMLFSGISGIGQSFIRIPMSILIVLISLALFVLEGLSCGTKDAAESRRVRKLERDGLRIDLKDLADCWHPGKCIIAILLVFLLPIGLAIWIAVTAEPYRYQLQDLPLWLTENYGTREEVMAPLAAYLTEEPSASPRIILRIGLRALIMPFIGFFSDPQIEVYWLDHLSPLFLFLYPFSFFTGYLFGPWRSRKIATKERRSKKIAIRRAEKRSLAEELTRGGGEVHYGGRAEEKGEKHKLV